MSTVDRIGVGVVFDEHARDLINSAASLSGDSAAVLDLIHVLRPPAFYERVLPSAQQRPDIERAAEQARTHLEELAATKPIAGTGYNCHVTLGNPDVEITSKTEELGCTLTLLGPSRRDGLLRMGRTARRVVRRSRIPVLVAKNPVFGKPSRIVAATDFSDASKSALEQAASLARFWDADLVLLHVLEPLLHLHGLTATIAGESEVYTVEPEDLEPEWSALISETDLTQIDHRHETVKGECSAAIAKATESLGADLLVIATHGRTGFSHAILGSVAEAVLEDAPCSVLVVRAAAPSAPSPRT